HGLLRARGQQAAHVGHAAGGLIDRLGRGLGREVAGQRAEGLARREARGPVGQGPRAEVGARVAGARDRGRGGDLGHGRGLRARLPPGLGRRGDRRRLRAAGVRRAAPAEDHHEHRHTDPTRCAHAPLRWPGRLGHGRRGATGAPRRPRLRPGWTPRT
ncbi:MAG: hypothetical protein ACK559_29645, partial [bacterium]